MFSLSLKNLTLVFRAKHALQELVEMKSIANKLIETSLMKYNGFYFAASERFKHTTYFAFWLHLFPSINLSPFINSEILPNTV